MISEVLSILASVCVMVSVVFPTNSIKNCLRLRIFNLVGSVLFITYGSLLLYITVGATGYSVVISNVFCVVFNLIDLIKIKKKLRMEDEPHE